MATWTLAVRLMCPIYPEEHKRWDQNYSQIQTPQECELLAKKWWKNFYDQYGLHPEQSSLSFWTKCTAHAHHVTWIWDIKCTNAMECTTDKHKIGA